MPTETWNITTIDGKQYLVVDVAKFRIPLDWDPSSNMFFAVSYPDGGIGNFTALAKGDTGDVPTLSLPITVTELAADDPTAASGSFTEVSPDTYTMSVTLHKGAKGDPGDTVLSPADYGDALAGDFLVVNPDLNSFVPTPQRLGDRYLPANIVSTPSGNAGYTLCTVGVPPQRFAWRPQVEGFCEMTGTGSNVKVDLLVRRDSPTAGNIVGRATQPPGQYPATHVLSSIPPIGSPSDYDIVQAGVPAVFYLRAERVSGSDTFTTSTTTTGFCVRVTGVPPTIDSSFLTDVISWANVTLKRPQASLTATKT
jgi:hypothetical protein